MSTKKLNLIFIFVIISITCFSQNRTLYYWDGSIKRNISVDSSQAIASLSSTEYINLRGKGNKFETVSIGQTYKVLIKDFKAISEEDKSQIAKRFGYSYFSTENPSSNSFIGDEITIKLKNSSSIDYLVDKYKLKFTGVTTYGAHIFMCNNWSKTLETANKIFENEKQVVEWSCPNFISKINLFTDPLYTDQYYLNNTGQLGGIAGYDINAPEAWQLTTGCALRVAVIDDGVNNHEEFGARLLAGFTTGANNNGGAQLNGNGKSHGVACAGIISAAHDNDLGIKGVAPNSLIIPVNIFPEVPTEFNPAGAATNAQIAGAINWAWRPDGGNADILSNSWGGGLSNPDITTEITNARTQGRGNLGSIVVFASGNSLPAGSVSFPGNIDGVITVGAIDNRGNLWNYSNRGPEMDLVAPSGNVNLAGDVRTTDRMGADGFEVGNYTNRFGGTSAACPQVSGIAALMLSVNPNLTEAQVRTILQQTASDLGASGFDNNFGFGLVNAQKALNRIQSDLGLVVNGSNIVCTTGQFTLANQPTGTTITWSTNNPNLSINPTTGLATRLNNLNSVVTIIATVTPANGCPYNVLRDIIVGVGISDPLFTQKTVYCPYSYQYSVLASITPAPGTATYKWYIDNILKNTTSYATGVSVPGGSVDNLYHTLRVDITNVCGNIVSTANPEGRFKASCSGGGGGTLSIYPNPSSSDLTVEFIPEDGIIPSDSTSSSGSSTFEFSAVLFDSYGQKRKSSTSSNSKIAIDIRDVPKGLYFLHVSSNGNIVIRQILVDK